MRRRTALAGLLSGLFFLGLAAAGVAGVAVEGHDRARILPPSEARVVDYSNAGYRLVVHGAEAHVEVEVLPIGSRSIFELPPRGSADPIDRVARAQTSGAATRFEAVSRILAWVSRHVEYRLDRREPQTAEAVLERRTGYCTGVARLTVALLEAVGIEAREVAGYVADPGPGERESRSSGGGPFTGYHRWIEVWYPDVGWVFSDPLTSHHWIPATYVPLASDELRVGGGMDGLLLERWDQVVAVDVHYGSAPGVRARRNSERRLAASLRVRVEGAKNSAEVMLHGGSTLYRRHLAGGEATFVGLEPGRYELRLRLSEGEWVSHVELPDRRAAGLTIRIPESPASPPRRFVKR